MPLTAPYVSAVLKKRIAGSGQRIPFNRDLILFLSSEFKNENNVSLRISAEISAVKGNQ